MQTTKHGCIIFPGSIEKIIRGAATRNLFPFAEIKLHFNNHIDCLLRNPWIYNLSKPNNKITLYKTGIPVPGLLTVPGFNC